MNSYGKPNGAKFKKQNWLHVQQICYQGQGRFQSSSTKSIHVQPIFSQGQDIENQAQQNQFTFNQFSLKVKTFRIKPQQNNVVTFKKLPFKGKRYLSQAQQNNVVTFQEKFISVSRFVSYQPQIPCHVSTTVTHSMCQAANAVNNPNTLSTTTPSTFNKVVKQILRVLFMKYLPIFTLGLRSLY